MALVSSVALGLVPSAAHAEVPTEEHPVIRPGNETKIKALVAAKDAADSAIEALSVDAISIEKDTIIVRMNQDSPEAVVVTLRPVTANEAGATAVTSTSFVMAAEFDRDAPNLDRQVTAYLAGIRARDDGSLYTLAKPRTVESPDDTNSAEPWAASLNLGAWWWLVWASIAAITAAILWPRSEDAVRPSS